ncbi:Hsp70 family protein [Nannocystis pusilla]|uniref:Hsp70 family protein n=1 Tax=Nannocystis pusilla TaxID=889268 RepID=A0A9X3EQ19_9BACT|nr:Hsp70 family protein [Nannocystis pusilla]MCY1007284.1 Hsp70 family protein [Nannocystis pusilla]
MTSAPLYVGIDLGTTNSTAAVFDGEKVTLVRNAQGSPITPSVVRIDARGNVTVGAKARRFLDTDADNTRSEFKRLMGTAQGIRFGAAGLERRPEELAAEVLRSLRADVRDQIGVLPARAVISVPALFELPQTSATSEAARLAGFERVELLQEPIASALAAGWTVEDQGGAWLVYDLGGGTFDVSLLETRDGLLRVVGHDGDNFLGGRDFDWAIVDWAIAQAARDGVVIRRGDPTHAAAVRKIKLAAEEAKIELSRAESASITVPGLDVGGASHDLDVTLDRETLERLCAPAIDRSIAVCRRLLQAHGVAEGGLTRVVLVGGPSVMPVVRRLVSQQLAVPPAEGLDPMTLVAQGAAIFAATAGLEARPSAIEQVRGAKVWLQYPAMSSDLTPHVVGRLVERTGPVNSMPTEIQLARADGLWDSPWTPLDEEGAFVLPVSLVPRKPNVFRLTGKNIQGNAVTIDPPTLTIVQGLTISDPPLSRTIGVALASNDVRVYFERGAPLPARRTFTLHTVDSVARGAEKAVIKIPIVQGEYEQAHLCRLVGALEIGGKELKQTLASGAEVELTIELDRGGRMSARADPRDRPGVRARGAPAGAGGRPRGARVDGDRHAGPARRAAHRRVPPPGPRLDRAPRSGRERARRRRPRHRRGPRRRHRRGAEGPTHADRGRRADRGGRARPPLAGARPRGPRGADLDHRVGPGLRPAARADAVPGDRQGGRQGPPGPRPARAAAPAAAPPPRLVGLRAPPRGVEAPLRGRGRRRRQRDRRRPRPGAGQGGPRGPGQGRQRGAAAGDAEAVAAAAERGRGPAQGPRVGRALS